MSVIERKPCMREHSLSWVKNIPLCFDSLSFIHLLLKHVERSEHKYYSLDSWINLFVLQDDVENLMQSKIYTIQVLRYVCRLGTRPELAAGSYRERDVEICTDIGQIKNISVWWLIYEDKCLYGHPDSGSITCDGQIWVCCVWDGEMMNWFNI